MATVNFDATEIATQAIEAAGAIASGIQSLKILGLAEDYYDLYKRQREFYYNVFQQGVETPLINIIYNEPVYNRNYAGRAATLFEAGTGPFSGAVTDTVGWWTRHSNMYGVMPEADITSLEADEARLKSDWANHMFRFEEHWADLRNDTRWERRLMAHNVGMKQGSAVASALDGALNSYQQSIADFGSSLATFGNGYAKYAGYKRGLADTADAFYEGTRMRASVPSYDNTKRPDAASLPDHWKPYRRDTVTVDHFGEIGE